MRRWFRWLHLWLGLVIAVPVVVTAGTGVVLTWAKELAPIVDGPEWLATEEGEPLDWPGLVRSVYEAYPEARILHLGGDPDSGYALPVWLDQPDGGVRPFLLDPVTGDLTAREQQSERLKWIETLHRNLHLGPVGRQIVAVSSLAMAIIALLGVVLWWPMRRGTLRGLWRRRALLRWHNLLGLAVLPLLLVFALTGITLTYNDPLFDVLHRLAGTPTQPDNPKPRTKPGDASLETLFAKARAAVAKSQISGVNEAQGDTTVYTLRLRKPGEVHPSGWHSVRVEAGSGQLLSIKDHRGGSWAAWYEQMWYVLHTGSFLGPIARGIWALASLVIVILAVTGFWHWARRKRPRH